MNAEQQAAERVDKLAEKLGYDEDLVYLDGFVDWEGVFETIRDEILDNNNN
jgi:hypothetical protein